MQPFVGVISDTHGLVRPGALEALRGADFIIHAGDVGDAIVLEQLETIAPVHAVRGNVDFGALGERLPEDALVSWRGKHIYVYHILEDLPLDPAAAGIHAVVYGHSHKPDISEKNGVLYFNPGSAGPRRFALPISLGRFTLEGDALKAELIELKE
ncbi:MAG: metallophosphoesterase family protein [Candidatus Hydrogenedentes bacterium]|nr:metallophosphoesterase family protein [Candidatus Hydrogenedentota bacterium]